MGGGPWCHGAEEHVACPDLPHFEGLVAAGALVDGTLKSGMETTAVAYRSESQHIR